MIEPKNSKCPVPSPRVQRFESLAFGMFVHWGLYSQLEQGEWIQHFRKIPRNDYLELMSTFTACDFDAPSLVQLAVDSGMKYITLTSRHHEGFSLYNTRGLSKLDVTQTPCQRDLILEFVTACRDQGIVPMLYHTTLDWNDERFENDWKGYLQYLRASIEILCTCYGEIGGFWFDGNWSRPNADWEESELYGVIRKYQPQAMIINNTGVDELGRGGHPEVDSVTFERGRPEPLNRLGAEKYVASEMCHTMNFHWGFAKQDYNFLSPAHVIEELCFARRAGANLLMNLGPEPQGKLPSYESAVLRKAGQWLKDMGEILYRGHPSSVAGEGSDFALELDGQVYLFVTDISPTSNTQFHSQGHRGAGTRRWEFKHREPKKITWVESGEQVEFDFQEGVCFLEVQPYPYGSNLVIRIAKVELEDEAR